MENIYELELQQSPDGQELIPLDDHGQPCLTLEQIVEALPYRHEFVLRAIISGRLKGFRIGAQWWTTAAWVRQYQQKVRDHLVDLIGDEIGPSYVKLIK